ncbi:hypothetical protein GKZ89_14120 [Bacillus mangrovi]|uniref:Pre-toxin TG domain-containing protein n=1 Tax=Metabacillus mangrovi TaxID=1491830 RepID=A0A7X2S7C3_9BACI|nr:pre-toxin TG domain-containing protein [Metabacillus mangrovi]MTH54536.1 hypothetical protein [Metabacillus mangrovi]
MTDIQIKPSELLELAKKIGESIQMAQEGQTMITGASSYATTEAIENAKMKLVKQLETYLETIDHGHQKVFVARELMLGTDKNYAAIYDENEWSIPKSIKDNPMAIIEWKRKNIHMENGVLVNPMGYKDPPKPNMKESMNKFVKAERKRIAKVVPRAKLVKKKFDWGEHFRQSAEMSLNMNPTTMGLQDQVKMLTGYDLLTFKKISNSERKQSTSAWVDGIPIVSNIKSAVELDSGVNPISGEKLSGFDKAAAALTIVGGTFTRPIKPGIRAVKTIPKQFVRKADDVVGKVDGKTGAFEALNKGTGNVQTGGRELSIDEYLKRLDNAEEMYESFRKSKTDVQSIANNTGMTKQRIQRIKEHLFINEHIKEHGIGRFESDYQIAQAWDRLQKGTYNKNDIDLLNHELFESKFEGIFKTDYRSAHDKTVESGRPWYPPEEE